MSFLLFPVRAARTSLPAATRTFTTTPSRSLARISIIGRLGAAPEFQTTNNGTEFMRYVIGTSTGPRDAQGNRATSWFRVTNFRPQEEGSKGRDFLQNLDKGYVNFAVLILPHFASLCGLTKSIDPREPLLMLSSKVPCSMWKATHP